jgi:hypothetical protein
VCPFRSEEASARAGSIQAAGERPAGHLRYPGHESRTKTPRKKAAAIDGADSVGELATKRRYGLLRRSNVSVRSEPARRV